MAKSGKAQPAKQAKAEKRAVKKPTVIKEEVEEESWDDKEMDL